MKGLFQCPPRFIGYTELFVFAGYHLCYLYKSNTMLKHTAVVRPSGWRRKASKERCFMAGLCHWIFVPFPLGNKLIHVI